MKSTMMNHSFTFIASTILLLSSTSHAFVTTPMAGQRTVFTPAGRVTPVAPAFVQNAPPNSRNSPLQAAASQMETDTEIERLRLMAAQLRAEAATLEAEQQEAVAEAAEKAFQKFDTNQDGSISIEEFKQGLEKTFKLDLPEARVERLMQDFDQSGDGALQLDEFVTVDKFRNRLDALAREEKALAREKARTAQEEADAAKLLEAQLEVLNEKPPTNTDKLVSVLPYLLPLVDALPYARFLINDNQDSAISAVAAVAYGLYRSIPFGGLIAFYALSFLSGNPSINRLVRFNMQQAISVDIALIIPGLLAGLSGLLGLSLPSGVEALGNDAVFATLMLTLAYASVSSLLGQTPNKIPFISNAVEDRMPTIDMFDAEGRFIPRELREKDENKEE